MQPQTEGLEEQGPSGVPFINDPKKPANLHKPLEEPEESEDGIDELEDE